MQRIRKSLALALIAIQVGCNNSPLVQQADSTPFSDLAFKAEVSDPGAMHNEIVHAYNRRRPIGSRTPLVRDEFIQNCIDAANEVLETRGIAPVVGRAEIEHFLSFTLEMKKKGVYDLTSPATSDVTRVPQYMLQRGDITVEEKRVLDETIRALKTRGAAPAMAILAEDETSFPRVRLFRDIFEASSELWGRQITARSTKFDDGPEIMSRNGDGAVMDAGGALFGLWLGGPVGSILFATLFSLMIYEEPPSAGGGWTCSDWCDAG